MRLTAWGCLCSWTLCTHMHPKTPMMASTCLTAQTPCTSMGAVAVTTGCGTPAASTMVSPPHHIPCSRRRLCCIGIDHVALYLLSGDACLCMAAFASSKMHSQQGPRWYCNMLHVPQHPGCETLRQVQAAGRRCDFCCQMPDGGLMSTSLMGIALTVSHP